MEEQKPRVDNWRRVRLPGKLLKGEFAETLGSSHKPKVGSVLNKYRTVI